MPRPKRTKSTAPTKPPELPALDAPKLIDTLAHIQLNTLDIGAGCVELGISKDQLADLVEAGGEPLAAAVRQRMESMRTHPDRVLSLSTNAVTDAAEELARRIKDEGHTMTTSELNQSIANLEKLAGLSESRKQEIKDADKASDEKAEGYMLLQDYRSADRRLINIIVGPGHPCRIPVRKFDPLATKEQRRQHTLDILNRFFPRCPKTGDFLNLPEHIAKGVQFMEPPFNSWG